MLPPKEPRGAVILPFRRRDPHEPPPERDRDPVQVREDRVMARYARAIDSIRARIGTVDDMTEVIAKLEQEDTDTAATTLPTFYLVRSIRRELDQDNVGALDDAERALALAPDDIDALRTTAKLLERCGKPGGLALLDRAAAIAPTDLGTYLVRGDLLAEQGDHERAITNFHRALTLDATCKAAHVALAKSFEALGRLEDAFAACTAALRLDPNNSGLRHTRALYHYDKGDIEGAIRDLDRALKLRPNEPYWFADRAAAHAIAGRPQQAIADYTRAMQLEPNESDFASMRSVLHLQARAFDPAIADLTIAIRLKPSFAPYYWRRALLRHAVGDLVGAIVDHEIAVAKDPEEMSFRSSLARCLFAADRTADALHAVAEGLARAPDNAELLLDRAEILKLRGEDSSLEE